MENEENYKRFIYQPMMTCIGNKRKLIKYILPIINEIKIILSKDKLNIMDAFTGSTVVARGLSYFANKIYVNDMELYSYIMAFCFFNTPTTEQQEKIIKHISNMNDIIERREYIEGIISRLYAPKNTDNVKINERCFYTRENALIIDTLRQYIENNVEEELKYYCLAPLLIKASIHTNTSGVFKSFYKKNGIGHFGGKGENALTRIKQQIHIDVPHWNTTTHFIGACFNKDINQLIQEIPPDIDIIYLDPPYNQHPYGSNYFMLNIIAQNVEPTNISRNSGIPINWNKSKFNKKSSALRAMKQLIECAIEKSKYLLISYNNEGVISKPQWDTLFLNYHVKKYEIVYNTYKGSRNLRNRNNKVIEILYLVNKK